MTLSPGSILSLLVMMTTLHSSNVCSLQLLSLPFDELSSKLGGSGKAKLFWDNLRNGIDPLLTSTNIDTGLSSKAKNTILGILEGQPLIPSQILTESVSPCGTRKFLHRLHDGQSVESVLIPALTQGRTTLCLSTQIGCDRGCTFCLTGNIFTFLTPPSSALQFPRQDGLDSESHIRRNHCSSFSRHWNRQEREYATAEQCGFHGNGGCGAQ